MLTVHGVGASQPSRAVFWTCLIRELPFVFKETPIGHFGPEGSLAALNPTGQVPTVEDGDSVLYEMPAILCYLCDKHGWADLYPPDLKVRAYINQYLHFHHSRRQGQDALEPGDYPRTKVGSRASRPRLESKLFPGARATRPLSGRPHRSPTRCQPIAITTGATGRVSRRRSTLGIEHHDGNLPGGA